MAAQLVASRAVLSSAELVSYALKSNCKYSTILKEYDKPDLIAV
jgi:hypothetical protein